MQKVLGKIVSAEFGKVRDYPFLIGLLLKFQLGDCSCVGSTITVNIGSDCKWKTMNREEAITKMVEDISAVLRNAKCIYVSELVGKPVEVTLDKNMFHDFRILTEVL